MDVAGIVASITSIQSDIADLGSQYREVYRLTGGLSGSLAMMLEFVTKRINDENPVSMVTMSHLGDTLDKIEAKLKEVAELDRRTWCGCVPVGRAFIFFGPMCGSCGSKRLIKQLTDLAGDLEGDTDFVKLQMMANTVNSLNDIAEANTGVLENIESREVRAFWNSWFRAKPAVSVEEFARALSTELDVPEGSATYVGLTVGEEAQVVQVVDLDEKVGGQGVRRWFADCLNACAYTVGSPAHTGAVTCMAVSGFMLLTGSEDRTIKAHTVETNGSLSHRHTMIGHGDAILCIDALDNTVISSSRDKSIIVWHNDRNRVKHRYWLPEPAVCLKVIDEVSGARACQGYVSPVTVFNLATGETMYELRGHVGGTLSMHYDRSNCRLVTGGVDRAVQCWDLGARRDVFRIPAEQGEAIGEVGHACDNVVVSCSSHTLKITNGDTGVVAYKGSRQSTLVRGLVSNDNQMVVLQRDAGNPRRHSVTLVDCADGTSAAYTVVTRPDASPTRACAIRGMIYIGFDDGAVRWYSADADVLAEAGVVQAKGSTVLRARRPLVACAARHVFVADRGSGGCHKVDTDMSSIEEPCDVDAVTCLRMWEGRLVVGGCDKEGIARVVMKTSMEQDRVVELGYPGEVTALLEGTSAKLYAVVADRWIFDFMNAKEPIMDRASRLLECGFRGRYLVTIDEDDIMDVYDVATTQHLAVVNCGDLGLQKVTHLVRSDSEDHGMFTVHGETTVVKWTGTSKHDASVVAHFPERIQDIHEYDYGLRVSLQNGGVVSFDGKDGTHITPTVIHHRPGGVVISKRGGGGYCSYDPSGSLVLH